MQKWYPDAPCTGWEYFNPTLFPCSCGHPSPFCVGKESIYAFGVYILVSSGQSFRMAQFYFGQSQTQYCTRGDP